MHTRSKCALLALIAASVLAQAATTASARQLSVDGQYFRIVWSTVRFFANGFGEFSEARCPVTLEGSFHARTFTKRVDSQIGVVTRAIVSSGIWCAAGAGEAQFLSPSLPWPIRYEAFAGTLPFITRIRVAIIGVALKIRYFGVSCLYSESGSEHILGEFLIEFPLLGRFSWNPEEVILESGGRCLANRAAMEGTGRVTFLNETSEILIELI